MRFNDHKQYVAYPAGSRQAKVATPTQPRLSANRPFPDRAATARTDIPRCTDIDVPVPYRENKHVLFGQQEGRCNGCRSEFPSAS